ncbi:DNA-binding protein [Cohaesibacter sp. ES.047]|uniref:DNA-binding protein n=1 Tax=Cohaesibacter sp. ES.047 TaxID=1798205 RepID=UPI001FCEE318|nr:DNA-binding protein [Cohaesibacter sp. ES.047]
MTQKFFTAAEIAEMHGSSLRYINQLAARQGWRKQTGKAQKRAGRGGGWEYHLDLLPEIVRTRLAVSSEPVEKPKDRNESWQHFEGLSKARKEACERRLKVVDAVDQLIKGGMTETAATSYAANKFSVAQKREGMA